MLGLQTRSTAVGASGHECLICSLIDHHQYAEAYQLLIKESSPSLATYFNTALCLIYAKNYQQALMALDSAYGLVPVSYAHIEPRTETYLQIVELQNGSDSYTKPISSQYVTLFPTILKDTILRLKVDCYLQLQQWHKVLNVGSKINNYKNVSAALMISKQQLEIL